MGVLLTKVGHLCGGGYGLLLLSPATADFRQEAVGSGEPARKSRMNNISSRDETSNEVVLVKRHPLLSSSSPDVPETSVCTRLHSSAFVQLFVDLSPDHPHSLVIAGIGDVDL